jgi:hypothetical protein
VDTANTAIFLNEYALGRHLTMDHFSVREHPLPPVPDRGLMIQTMYLSVDPYMRGCMTGLGNYYIPQFELSVPVFSMGIGQVLESRDRDFPAGDIVVGALDWSPMMVWDPAETSDRQPGGTLCRIQPGAIALSHHLGALGTTGLTAFFGVLAVARPQPAETFLVSSAAGGVGSIAGQIAKLRGARVYGLTSTKEKRDVLMHRLDFEDVLDYRRSGLQRLIEAEAIATIGAGRYERTEGRAVHRNGHRPKTVSTTSGDIEIQIPKLRAGSFFPSLLERRRRIDRALHAVIMEAYVHGVSTRSVDDLVAAMGVETGVSKSEVSRICAGLDREIEAFRTRSLTQTQFPYVFCDATFCKVRVGAHVVSQALVVATGVHRRHPRSAGHRGR